MGGYLGRNHDDIIANTLYAYHVPEPTQTREENLPSYISTTQELLGRTAAAGILEQGGYACSFVSAVLDYSGGDAAVWVDD